MFYINSVVHSLEVTMFYINSVVHSLEVSMFLHK